MIKIRSILALGVGIWATYYLVKEIIPMIDPLKYSSLTDADIRIYRYLHALQEISGIDGPEPSLDVEVIRTYLSQHKAVQCSNVTTDRKPGCDRIYINEITKCPVDSFDTISIPYDAFLKWVYQWETFRQRYAETSRIRGLTRVWAVRLYYLIQHPLEG
jgi:hypothetical protein